MDNFWYEAFKNRSFFCYYNAVRFQDFLEKLRILVIDNKESREQ